MRGVLETFENSKEERERKTLLERAIVLYRSARTRHAELPVRCLELLDELEERDLTSRLPEKALDHYPFHLELFEFESESAVREYFLNSDLFTIRELLEQTENTLSESWEYNTLKNWVAEASYLVKRYDEKKRREDAIRAHRDRQLESLSSLSMWG